MKQQDKKAFSIIEVMIAIFVFAFGLTSVFAMLSWSINMSDYSRNLIVASHLADEQLELFKNVRDSNYRRWQKWDIENPAETNFSSATFFSEGSYYKLMYNNSNLSGSFPIKVEELLNFQEGNSASELDYMNNNYRLCITPEWQYTYDCNTSGNEESSYYRFIHIEKPNYSGWNIDDAYKVTSTVIWTSKKTHRTEISTVVTDWKRY